MQNILNLGHVIENNDKLVIIAPWEGTQPLWFFCDVHFEIYNFPTLFYGCPKQLVACSYQKIVQAYMISINRKFSYHTSNIYFKTIKGLIHFILSYAWIHILKAKLLNRVLKISDVLINVNLGYKQLSRIRKFPNYLDCLRENVFVMIRQLGPLTFFMTFTTCVNNWLILIKTLKNYMINTLVKIWEYKRMIH
jgi:hypothetical protein